MIQDDDRNVIARITALEEQNKSVFKMLEDQSLVLKNLTDLMISTQLATEKLKRVTMDLSNVEKDIQDLKFKPVRYWDKIIFTIIGVIVSVVIAAVLAKFSF